VAILKGEQFFHSVTFFGDEIVTVPPGKCEEKSRTETCFLDEDEVLVGCELDAKEMYAYGITWLKWKPSQFT
jgi:hypothetical protein